MAISSVLLNKAPTGIRTIAWLAGIALLVYLPAALLGYGFYDQGSLLVFSQFMRDGLVPYRDFPIPVFPFTLAVHAMLPVWLSWWSPNQLSMAWTYGTYLAVALMALRWVNQWLGRWNLPGLTRSASAWWVIGFFLAGPVHEPYLNYTHDALCFSLVGLLLLGGPGGSDRARRGDQLELWLGSFCLGVALTSHQVIGAAAIGTGLVLLTVRLWQDDSSAPLRCLHGLVALGLMGLAPVAMVVLLGVPGALDDLYQWTIAWPTAHRLGVGEAARRLLTFSTRCGPVVFPLTACLAAMAGARLQNGLNRKTALTGRGWSRASSGVVWSVAIGFLMLAAYTAAIHEPSWLVFLSGGSAQPETFFAWGLRAGLRLLLWMGWVASAGLVGMLWSQRGRGVAIRIGVLLLALFGLYAAALLAGLSTVRLFRTLPVLSVLALLLVACARSVVPHWTAPRLASVCAKVVVCVFLVVVRLRGPEWSLADPIHRPVRYYKPLQGFLDRQLVDELEHAEAVVANGNGPLFIYQSDAMLYYFFKHRPPSLSAIHDAMTWIRQQGWDQQELARLRQAQVQTVVTLAAHQREDSFLFRAADPIRDWIEAEYQPVFSGQFLVVWQPRAARAPEAVVRAHEPEPHT